MLFERVGYDAAEFTKLQAAIETAKFSISLSKEEIR
jgi:hypothetical protein